MFFGFCTFTVCYTCWTDEKKPGLSSNKRSSVAHCLPPCPPSTTQFKMEISLMHFQYLHENHIIALCFVSFSFQPLAYLQHILQTAFLLLQKLPIFTLITVWLHYFYLKKIILWTYRDNVTFESMSGVCTLYNSTELWVTHSCLDPCCAYRTCNSQSTH